jgi:hypothetical protein
MIISIVPATISYHQLLCMGNLALPDALACRANHQMSYDSRGHLRLRTLLRKLPNLLQYPNFHYWEKLSSLSSLRLAHPMKGLGLHYPWCTKAHLSRVRNIMYEDRYEISSAAYAWQRLNAASDTASFPLVHTPYINRDITR